MKTHSISKKESPVHRRYYESTRIEKRMKGNTLSKAKRRTTWVENKEEDAMSE